MLGGICLLCCPAFSTILRYDTPASWQTSVDSIVTDNFDSNGPNTSVYYGGGYINPGLFMILVSPGGTMYNYYLPGNPYHDWGSNGIMRGPDNDSGTASVTINMLANTTAFAIELMSAPDAQPVYVTINNDIANTYTVSTLPKPGHQFVGFTSTDPITTVKLTSNTGTTVIFDNLSLATAQTAQSPGEAPETATFLLCGTGLFAVGFLRRRFHT